MSTARDLDRDVCTVTRFNGALHVRLVTTAENTPERITHYWPLSEVRSVAAFRLEGKRVVDSYDGVFRVHHTDADYWTPGLRDARAVLINGGKTESVHCEREPIAEPPRRGKVLRWYQGRWQRLLKKGWVDA